MAVKHVSSDFFLFVGPTDSIRSPAETLNGHRSSWVVHLADAFGSHESFTGGCKSKEAETAWPFHECTCHDIRRTQRHLVLVGLLPALHSRSDCTFYLFSILFFAGNDIRRHILRRNMSEGHPKKKSETDQIIYIFKIIFASNFNES